MAASLAAAAAARRGQRGPGAGRRGGPLSRLLPVTPLWLLVLSVLHLAARCGATTPSYAGVSNCDSTSGNFPADLYGQTIWCLPFPPSPRLFHPRPHPIFLPLLYSHSRLSNAVRASAGVNRRFHWRSNDFPYAYWRFLGGSAAVAKKNLCAPPSPGPFQA